MVDDGLITAGPTAHLEFARAVFSELGVYPPRVLDAWYRLHAEHDPDAYYALLEGA